jgi:arylsulfatase A-like enzyme
MKPIFILTALLLAPLVALHAADAPKPNIVFIFTDDQRFDTIAALGNPVIKTPNLDRLVRSGVSFRNHYIMGGTWGAVCVPSRNMMLTGRTLFHIAPPEEPSPATYKGGIVPPGNITLPGQLRTQGYLTFFTGKSHNYVKSSPHFEQGGRIGPVGSILEPAPEGQPTGHFAMQFKRWGSTQVEVHPGRHSTDVFGDDAVEFIERQQGERPFFLYLAFHAPHDPIMAPPEYEALYPAEKMPLPSSFAPNHAFETGSLNIRSFVVHREKTLAPYTPEPMRKAIGIYYAMITHLDAQVGRVLAALEAKGQLENTIIAFSSDNGFSLGDHGLNHKQSVYEQDVRVPLILSGPGLPKNETRDQLCYLLDLFPTLCELTGSPIPASVEGKSLLPIIRDATKSHRTQLYFAYDNFQRGCRDERFKLIEFAVPDKKTGAIARHTLLFDLQTDPKEETNLADQRAHADTLKKMRALLLRLRDQHGDTIERGSIFWKNHRAAVEQTLLSATPVPSQTRVPASLVRTETWNESWPDAAGQPQTREVKGEIWNLAIQAALDRDNAMHLPKRDQPYYLDGPIILKSGQKLTADPAAEIRLKPGTSTCMVRNERIIGFADKPVLEDTQPDTDITIEGGIWTTLANGAKDNHGNQRGHSSKLKPVPGTHGVILLHNVRKVSVRNVTVRQSKPFAIHLGNIRDFTVDGLTLDRHGRDGVHVDGPASDGVIRNVSGDSHDDPVSLTAWDWKQYSASFGPIHHLAIERITGAPEGKRSTDAIRLLPGVKRFNDGTTLDCPIHDITMRDITDIRDFKLYDQPNLEAGRDKDFSAGIGTLENIVFENLTFNRPGSIQVHANTDGLTLRGAKLLFALPADYHLIELGPKSATYQGAPGTDPSRWTEIFSPDLDCTVRNLAVTGVRTRDGQTDMPIEQIVKVIEQGPNPDYPKTTPKGGTGKGIWIR